jgi:putative glutamine amidotransferase|tara:strand:+ start:1958 stop:2560 length:603 start_codon:yes stop_codon:yes gene_type:complete
VNILIIPKVYCRYKDQLEYSLEKNYFFFLKKIFTTSKIEVAIGKQFYIKPNLIILTGGNNITLFSKKKEDVERDKIDNFFYKYAIKNKLPIFGICHGAHFIARKFKCRFKKSNKHIKKHKIKTFDGKNRFVNSFHRITISKKGTNLKTLAKAEDDTVEAFINIKSKVGGIIWHPERFKQFKNIDIKIIKDFYAACNTSIR